ncbi:MAG: hypothetical protein NTU41_14535 [Chloroflexi bacterium]|nr:hypothetical protein [Chloroflexota bacterium]
MPDMESFKEASWEAPPAHLPTSGGIDRQNPLTRIPQAYTLSTPLEGEDSELGGIIVKGFLDTLAEVAMSVAARNTAQRNQETR